MSETIQIYVDGDQLSRIDTIAASLGLSRSSYCRAALLSQVTQVEAARQFNAQADQFAAQSLEDAAPGGCIPQWMRE